MRGIMHLYDYQLEGVEFIKKHQGCILADDIGLGKTIQALKAIEPEIHKSILIVCPKTLITHWKSEIKKVLNNDYQIYHKIEENIQGRRILLVNYHYIEKLVVFSINNKKYHLFDYIIFDEAHKIKNWLTSLYFDTTCLFNYNPKAKKVFLTATPIVNKKEDLINLLMLTSSEVLQYIRKNKYDKTNFPDEFIHKYVLSRKKENYLLLPKVYLKTIFLEKDVWIEQYLRMLKRENDTGNSGWNMITKAKQVCITPYTINNSKFVLPPENSKIREVVKTIEKHKENGEQILVFSDFRNPLFYLGTLLKDDYRIITGKTKLEDRDIIIQDFKNKKFKVLLLTLRVGGEGLNLSNANIVIFLDLWWHWASFTQALNRTHRIGQDKEVWVYHYLYEGTIEEKNREIIRKKKRIMI